MSLRKIIYTSALLFIRQAHTAPVYVTVEGVLDETQGHDPRGFVLFSLLSRRVKHPANRHRIFKSFRIQLGFEQ